jgi:hypothetical protein
MNLAAYRADHNSALKSGPVIALADLTTYSTDTSEAPTASKDQAISDCRYKADAATASIEDPIEMGLTEGRLFNECLRAKGYALNS